jgi:hypothetical protein
MLDLLHSLNISIWNNLPLLSKIWFAAAGALLVLYIGIVIRGRYSGETRRRTKLRVPSPQAAVIPREDGPGGKRLVGGGTLDRVALEAAVGDLVGRFLRLFKRAPAGPTLTACRLAVSVDECQ